MLDDEAAQLARWGEVRVRRGPWPDGTPKIKPGTHAWDAARDRARALALALPFEPEQRAALAEVTATYGLPSQAHSRTIPTYGPTR